VQATIGRAMRRKTILLAAVLAVVGMLCAGCAVAIKDQPREGQLGDTNREREAHVANRVELTVVSGDGLRALRTAQASGGGMLTALESIRRDGPEAMAYDHAPHYLAFVMAYLRDEDLLPDRDWGLGDAFYEERKRITDVTLRDTVELDDLRAENFDIAELRQEFHAGGPLNDPVAGEALKDALRVLQENFRLANPDGAVVVAY
jgi:hypothetical protein